MLIELQYRQADGRPYYSYVDAQTIHSQAEAPPTIWVTPSMEFNTDGDDELLSVHLHSPATGRVCLWSKARADHSDIHSDTGNYERDVRGANRLDV